MDTSILANDANEYVWKIPTHLRLKADVFPSLDLAVTGKERCFVLGFISVLRFECREAACLGLGAMLYEVIFLNIMKLWR